MPRELKIPRIVGTKVLIQLQKTEFEGNIEVVEKQSTESVPYQGVVLATGSGKVVKGKTVPMDITPGDKVLLPKWAGNMITIKETDYIITEIDNILAVVE